MHYRNRMLAQTLLTLMAAIAALVGPSRQTLAVGEASTRFGIFVPPSSNATRDPTLVVTAMRDGTSVTITDDSTDGDSDDTVPSVTLSAGQSYIIYIQEGAVNDDGTGKADGDFFVVTSSHPVIVANLTVNTDWQHEFVPADNRRMSGTNFYLYRPLGATQTDSRNELLNVISYSNNTDLTIIDITATAKTTSGATSVVPAAQGATILSTTLQAGQDLQEVNAIKVRLSAGRTYQIIANKDVTVMFGALGKAQNASRDGGGYVPGKSGYSTDKTFYFAIPYYLESERELRLIAYGQPADVTVRGWSASNRRWNNVATYPLTPYSHAELIGAELGSGHYFFEVTSSAPISVFETNWLETTNSSYQTADIATFISAEDGTGAGRYFQAYIGPPGQQPSGGSLSHLYVSANQASNVVISDSDSYGEYIELYNGTGQTIDLRGWTLTNGEGRTITIPSGRSVAAGQTFLLEFHTKATNATAGYVYGTEYSRFRMRNAGDTLTLRQPDGSTADQVTFGSWGSGAIYRALERINPGQPLSQSNARDATAYTAKSTANLGDYYGSPGSFTPPVGATSGLVITELMAGRFLRRYTIAPNSYADVQVNVSEWEGINNGEPPLTDNGNPENPYLVIEADTPVSVLNSNWNDNWLTYGTGILQPDPYISHVADYYQRRAGEAVVLTTYVETNYGTLYGPTTTISVPPGITYTPGSYSTPSQLAGVTPSEVQNPDGSTTLTWVHGSDLTPNDIYRFQFWGVIAGGQAQGAMLSSVAITRGTDAGLSNLYSSQDTAVITVGADEPTTINEVVINEVLPQPGCAGAEWIELYNRGSSDISIGGWEIADEDGFVYRFAPNTFIGKDSYLTLSLSDGADTARERYTGKEFANLLGDSGDQISLYTGSGRTAAALVDFVAWGPSDPDSNLAIAAGQWPAGVVLNAPGSSLSIGRDRNATDTNVAGDWDNSGGPDSDNVPSPGTSNISIPGIDVLAPDAVTGLAAAAIPGESGAIRLAWANPSNGDLAGVRIVRSATTYPAKIGDGTTVYNGLAGTFVDQVTPGVPVYYAAFAYDDAENIACLNPGARARVVPPQSILLAFEDLKGASWVDWDMNDFVVSQETTVQSNDLGVFQIEVYMTAKARGSTFDHSFNLTVPISGASSVLVERFDQSGALTASEQSAASGSITVEAFPSTYAALPGAAGSSFANTVAGTAVVRGASARVVITLADPTANPLEALMPAPFDPWLRIRETGEIIRPLQAGGLSNTQRVREGLGALAGHDLPLALSFQNSWRWPLEMHPIYDAYPQFATFITSGGQQSTDWHTAPVTSKVWASGASPTAVAPGAIEKSAAPAHRSFALSGAVSGAWPKSMSGMIFASPAIVDLDGDGFQDVLIATQDGAVAALRADGSALVGWPQAVGSMVRTSPSVGDVDGDGGVDVVVGTDDGRIFAWSRGGAPLAGFPRQLGGPVKASVVLANLDADASMELVVHTGDALLNLLDGDGSPLAGWPRAMGGAHDQYGGVMVGSTPAVGDLDLDGKPEIAVGSTDGRLYVWRLSGEQAWANWPQQTGDRIYSSPLMVDLNSDGYRDIVVASGDGLLYAWRGDGVALPGFPLRLRDAIAATPAAVDIDQDGALELILPTLGGRVYAIRADGTIAAGWPRDAGSPIVSSPAVGDIDGDSDPEIVVGTQAGGVFAWHADGVPVIDWPRQTAGWVVSSPTIGDFGSDGVADVVVGSYDRHLYAWATGPFQPASIAWGGFRGGAASTGNVASGVTPLPLAGSYQVRFPLITR